MTPAVAILMLDDAPRMVCLGCSEILLEQGMLEIVKEGTLGDRDFVVRIYAIAPGFTLAECREAIKARHVGPAWGI